MSSILSVNKFSKLTPVSGCASQPPPPPDHATPAFRTCVGPPVGQKVLILTGCDLGPGQFDDSSMILRTPDTAIARTRTTVSDALPPLSITSMQHVFWRHVQPWTWPKGCKPTSCPPSAAAKKLLPGPANPTCTYKKRTVIVNSNCLLNPQYRRFKGQIPSCGYYQLDPHKKGTCICQRTTFPTPAIYIPGRSICLTDGGAVVAVGSNCVINADKGLFGVWSNDLYVDPGGGYCSCSHQPKQVAESNDCLVKSEQGGLQYSGHLADPLQLLPLDGCVAALIKNVLVGVSLSKCKGGRQAESVCSYWHGSVENPQLFCGAHARFYDSSAPLGRAQYKRSETDISLHAVMLDEDQQVAAKVRRRKASLARDLRQGQLPLVDERRAHLLRSNDGQLQQQLLAGACSYARLLLESEQWRTSTARNA
eukprot:SM000004S15141  [mRNA]  locus=s4:1443829:1450780:- [translate_table: standard]